MEKHERYNALFEIINNQIHHAGSIIQSEWEESKETHKVIRIAMFCKYYKTIQAIGKLDLQGYFEDAQVLLRCAYELLINLLYCNTNKTNYIRFHEFKYVLYNKYYNKLNAEQKKLVDQESLKGILRGYESYKNNYIKTNNDKKYWNGLNLYDTVISVKETYGDDIEKMYTSIYSLYSDDVHSNILGLVGKFLKNDEDDNLLVNSNPMPDSNYTEIIDYLEKMLIFFRMIDIDN